MAQRPQCHPSLRRTVSDDGQPTPEADTGRNSGAESQPANQAAEAAAQQSGAETEAASADANELATATEAADGSDQASESVDPPASEGAPV